MVTELARAGVDVEETDDGMIIRGGKQPRGIAFQTYKDHRIAMSLSILDVYKRQVQPARQQTGNR